MIVSESLPVPVQTAASRVPTTHAVNGSQMSRAAARVAAWLDRTLSLTTVAAVAFALLVFCWLPKNMADPDIWWHLRDAAVQASSHHWLQHDVFSATARGAVWIDHEWLAEVPYALGWHWGGPQGVLLISIAVTEAVMLLTFLLTYRLTRNLAVTMVFSTFAAIDATVSFGPRTLLFGWLCLIVELLLLERWSCGKLRAHTALWAFPLLFAAWVNLHGSWLIGVVLLAGYLLCRGVTRLSERPWAARLGLSGVHHMMERPRRRDDALWRAGGFSLLALLLNPYGWRLVAYPFDLAFKQTLNVATVEEWHSLDFHTPRAKIFLVMLAVLFIAQLLRRSRWALHELFFVAVGVYAALSYSRFLFLAGLLVCPIAAKQVAACWDAQRLPEATAHTPGWRGLLHLAFIAVMLLIAVVRFPSAKTMLEAENAYPRQAVVMLRTFEPRGPVLNEYTWGGFLEMYAPQVPVFIDPRMDIFERNGTLQDYLDVVRLKRPMEVLAKYHVRYVLFGRDTPLVLLLKSTRDWNVRYEDATTVLLERRVLP